MPIINSLDRLAYNVQPNFKRLAQLTREKIVGYSLYVGETLRLPETQMAYYARGRAPVALVKEYFKYLKLWELSDKEAATKSTETLYSKHIDGLAADCYLFDNKAQKILWNPPIELWMQLFAIAEDECGLDACASRKYNAWQWDWPHFEYRAPI